MILRTSIGGRRARVKLSNAFGSTPVVVGAAHLARRGTGAAIVAGHRSRAHVCRQSILHDDAWRGCRQRSGRSRRAGARRSCGQPVLAKRHRASDDARDGVAAPPTSRPRETSPGSPSSRSRGRRSSTTGCRASKWSRRRDAAAIVAFGDSITDGARSTPDTNNSWPALLAARLGADKATANIAVVNEGIGGNRLFTDAAGLAGVSALARLDRDVLSHPGVKWLMILEGHQRHRHAWRGDPPATPVTSDDLIWVLQQVIDRAHAHGIKVVGCTLTPYEGAGYARENGEAIRAAVNQWIRTSGRLRCRRRFRGGDARSQQSEALQAGIRSGRSPAPERRRLQGDGGRRSTCRFSNQRSEVFERCVRDL